MKVGKALTKASIKEETVSSESLKMYQMSLRDLGFWVIADYDSNDESKIKKLKDILKATDWKIDND